jgi:cytoskeleton protein RodZ
MGKLGDTLRERRQALGLNLEQVQEGTRIRQKLLEALEMGYYDRLPNPGYVRGYISSYARFLELDPVPLLNMYKAETGIGRQHELNLIPQASEAVAPTGQQHAVPLRAALGVTAVIGVISLGLWGALRISSGPAPSLPEPLPVTDTTTTPSSEPTNTAKPQKTSKSKKAEEPAAIAEPFTLTVRVATDGASWVRVTIDGKGAYEGTLTGGQSKEFEVARDARVRIGKPEAVTLLRDGQPVEIDRAGDVGDVSLSAIQTAR